jgi:hypothetical protein
MNLVWLLSLFLNTALTLLSDGVFSFGLTR